jgi:hypothetical protein
MHTTRSCTDFTHSFYGNAGTLRTRQFDSNAAATMDEFKLSEVSRRAFVRKLAGGSFVGANIGGPLADFLSAESVTPGSAPASGTALPFALPSPQGVVGVLPAIADAVLRGDAHNTNEGANPRLRVGINPVTRAVVRFDNATVFAKLTGDVQSVYLVLTIATNHNNWGQSDDRVVDCHPLLEDFTEGTGAQLALPGGLQRRGVAAGATWNSPEDPDCGDTTAPVGHDARRWSGGTFDSSLRSSAVHLNQMGGEIAFDVTAHVLAGCSAWLIKVRDEQPVNNGVLPVGYEDNYGGTVEYVSLQGGDADGKVHPPQLRFSALPSATTPAFAPQLAAPLASIAPASASPALTSSPPVSITPTLSPTLSATLSPTPTHTASPSPTLSPTNTPTPTHTMTPLPTISMSLTPTPTTTPIPSPTPSPAPSDTSTPTPAMTPTNTPTPSISFTSTPTPTATETPTPTMTPTMTPTPTAEETPTPTPTLTATPTPTLSAQPTPTPLPTPSPTPTPSQTPKPSKKPKHDHDDDDDDDRGHDRDDDKDKDKKKGKDDDDRKGDRR